MSKIACTATIVGQRAFEKISAIEGITLSKELSSDLAGTKSLSSTERRVFLKDKYARPTR